MLTINCVFYQQQKLFTSCRLAIAPYSISISSPNHPSQQVQYQQPITSILQNHQLTLILSTKSYATINLNNQQHLHQIETSFNKCNIQLLRTPSKQLQQFLSSYSNDRFVHCGTYNNKHDSVIKIDALGRIIINSDGKQIIKDNDGILMNGSYKWGNGDIFYFWKKDQTLHFYFLLPAQTPLKQTHHQYSSTKSPQSNHKRNIHHNVTKKLIFQIQQKPTYTRRKLKPISKLFKRKHNTFNNPSNIPSQPNLMINSIEDIPLHQSIVSPNIVIEKETIQSQQHQQSHNNINNTKYQNGAHNDKQKENHSQNNRDQHIISQKSSIIDDKQQGIIDQHNKQEVQIEKNKKQDILEHQQQKIIQQSNKQQVEHHNKQGNLHSKQEANTDNHNNYQGNIQQLNKQESIIQQHSKQDSNKEYHNKQQDNLKQPNKQQDIREQHHRQQQNPISHNLQHNRIENNIQQNNRLQYNLQQYHIVQQKNIDKHQHQSNIINHNHIQKSINSNLQIEQINNQNPSIIQVQQPKNDINNNQKVINIIRESPKQQRLNRQMQINHSKYHSIQQKYHKHQINNQEKKKKKILIQTYQYQIEYQEVKLNLQRNNYKCNRKINITFLLKYLMIRNSLYHQNSQQSICMKLITHRAMIFGMKLICLQLMDKSNNKILPCKFDINNFSWRAITNSNYSNSIYQFQIHKNMLLHQYEIQNQLIDIRYYYNHHVVLDNNNFIALATKNLFLGDRRIKNVNSIKQWKNQNQFLFLGVSDNRISLASKKGSLKCYDVRKINRALNNIIIQPNMMGLEIEQSSKYALIRYATHMCLIPIHHSYFENNIPINERQYPIILQIPKKLKQTSKNGTLIKGGSFNSQGSEVIASWQNYIIRWNGNNFKNRVMENINCNQINCCYIVNNGIVAGYDDRFWKSNK